jgi:hypothetical protein
MGRRRRRLYRMRGRGRGAQHEEEEGGDMYRMKEGGGRGGCTE